jgi:hypothetical protein
MVFHSLTEAMVPIFPTFYAMTGGLITAVAAGLQLQRRRVGRVYRALWHRGGDRRRNDRVSARSTR